MSIQEEGRRLVEMEKYKLDLIEIRDSIYNKSTNSLDYNRLRPAITLPHNFYCSGTEKEALLMMQRDAPCFDKYTLSEQTKQALKTPEFDIWQWEPNEMLMLMEEMYYELGLVEELSIHPTTLKNFLLRVQENYRNNPFHNFRHSFCVTQMMYVLIHACKLHKHLSKKDLCVLITACICHDLDHPGFNNTYQINARTEIAIRYNDMSPLENHHCAISFKILSQPECNILPIAAFMDRDRVTKPTAQVGFIRYVLLPLFESLSKLFPEFEQISLQNVRNSLTYYENLKEKEEMKGAAENTEQSMPIVQ